MKRKWAIVTVTHHADLPIISTPKLGMFRFWTRRAATRHAVDVCAKLRRDALHASGACITSASVVKLDKP